MEFSVMLELLIQGTAMTVEIFFVTLVLSLPLGMLVCFGRMSKNIVVRSFFKFYISVMRGTPLMLQLMVFYFGPFYLFGMQITETWKQLAWILGFSLNYAAYFAEIYRGGIESMPQGQYEAAMSLGVGYRDMMKDIILPQAIKHILPSLVNEAIALLKESSILSYIGAVELLRAADQITVLTFRFFEPYLVIALIYYIFVMVLSVVANRLERWVNRSDRVS